jgi:hypothetical protein
MKTPREILLEQHRSAAPKLDAIRREVLAEKVTPARAGGSGALAAVWLNWPVVLWRELIWPSRRIWAGLAAVWILIFVFNFSQRDPSELMARKTPPPSPEMILTFRQQEKLLAELIGPNDP